MKFEKYHGLGNDFLITTDNSLIDNNSLIKRLCDRHTGLGADGLMIVKQNPLEMVFYNQDGTRGEMCGNGIRCFSYFLYLNKIIKDNEFDLLTGDGVKHLTITSTTPFKVVVDMGKVKDEIFEYDVTFKDVNYHLYYLIFGVPHVVIFTDQYDEEIGKFFESNKLFKNKANINFVKKLDDKNYFVKTYERGVGFTKACGTGACSTFNVLKYLNKISDNVVINFELGPLNIKEKDGHIFMEGPSEKVGDFYSTLK